MPDRQRAGAQRAYRQDRPGDRARKARRERLSRERGDQRGLNLRLRRVGDRRAVRDRDRKKNLKIDRGLVLDRVRDRRAVERVLVIDDDARVPGHRRPGALLREDRRGDRVGVAAGDADVDRIWIDTHAAYRHGPGGVVVIPEIVENARDARDRPDDRADGAEAIRRDGLAPAGFERRPALDVAADDARCDGRGVPPRDDLIDAKRLRDRGRPGDERVELDRDRPARDRSVGRGDIERVRSRVGDERPLRDDGPVGTRANDLKRRRLRGASLQEVNLADRVLPLPGRERRVDLV